MAQAELNQLPEQRAAGLRARVSRSLIALLVRQIIANGAVLVGNIFLSRWLDHELYGVFAAALAFQTTLILLADIGLGPALIQREEPPTADEIAGLFTVQLLIFSACALIVWLAAPWIAVQAGLTVDGVLLVRTLALVLLLTAFRSIPAILLERELQLDVIALAETLSTLIYQIVLLTLVAYGFGIVSLIWALAARYLSDLLVIVYFRPWRPRLSARLGAILPYVRFGLHMQGLRVLALIKDQAPLLLLVPLLGAASAGYWGWSIAYIGIPVYLIRVVDRVMFPAYARVQHDPESMGQLVSIALWLNFALGLPILATLVLFARELIPLVYGGSWLTALPIVLLLVPNMLGSFVTGSVFPVLYATNQAPKALRLFAVWIGLTVAGGALGLALGRLPGLALAFSGATLVTSALLVASVADVARIDLRQALATPLLAALAAIAGALLLRALGVPWPVGLALLLLGDGLVLYVSARQTIHTFVSDVLKRT